MSGPPAATSREGDVGITTTVPVEVLLAAGLRPVDLNNRFVASKRASERIDLAERRGFPRNICAWVKGIYGTVVEEGIRTVVGVTQGDCSLTHALLEILETEGVDVIRFDYPYARDGDLLEGEIAKLESRFGVTRDRTEAVRRELAPVRRDLAEVDGGMARAGPPGSAAKAHLLLLSGSDLDGGDAAAFAARVKEFMTQIGEAQSERADQVRLALAGIPPIVDDLFETVERLGARIVLSEMAREFAMVRQAGSRVASGSSRKVTRRGIVEQYLEFAYPYDVFHRLRVLAEAVGERKADGVIHYVQSFCFRGVQDRLLRERVGVPVLTLECDRPGRLDDRSTTRLEAFVEMLETRSERPATEGTGCQNRASPSATPGPP